MDLILKILDWKYIHMNYRKISYGIRAARAP